MRHALALVRAAAPVAGLALAACGEVPAANGSGHDVPHAARYGGTAVVAHDVEIPTLNPVFTFESIGAGIQQYVLFTPVLQIRLKRSAAPAQKLDEKFDVGPALASSWEVVPLSADSSELVFRLRRDVYWHDGAPTTAHDLAFAYELLRMPPTGSPQSVPFFGDAVAADSFTFRVRFRNHESYLEPWASVTALPRHLLAGVPLDRLATHPYSTAPVGNGPFVYESHTPGESWTFVANERYPAALGGRPFLDRIVYRILPRGDAGLAELRAGRVDYLLVLPVEQAEQVRGSDAARVVGFTGESQAVLVWNTRRPPFDDARVRRAMAHAIDRPRLIEEALSGYAQASSSPVPSIHWAFDATAGQVLTYDPAAARALLREAGWVDRSGDGFVEDAGGRRLAFTLLVRRDDAVSRLLQRYLREVGADVSLEVLDVGAMLERAAPGRRDFDALLLGIGASLRLDLRDQFHCAFDAEPLHFSGYCDPEVDRLLDATRVVADREVAGPLWAELQRRLAADQPHTYLYVGERLAGVSERLRGVRPDWRGHWLDAARWWIPPEQR